MVHQWYPWRVFITGEPKLEEPGAVWCYRWDKYEGMSPIGCCADQKLQIGTMAVIFG